MINFYRKNIGDLYCFETGRDICMYEGDANQHHTPSFDVGYIEGKEPFVLLDSVEVQYLHYPRYKVLTIKGVIGWVNDSFNTIKEYVP